MVPIPQTSEYLEEQFIEHWWRWLKQNCILIENRFYDQKEGIAIDYSSIPTKIAHEQIRITDNIHSMQAMKYL